MSWPGTYFAPPPPRARRWVESVVGRGARVVRTRWLRGGTSSAVHRVDVKTASGTVVELVLRRHVRLDVLQEEPWLVEREALALRLLEQRGVPAPRLVAADAEGAECDLPAVLMTRVRGRLELRPKDVERWLWRMAELLPPINAIDPGDVSVPEWEVWDDMRRSRVPEWSRMPEVWRKLIELVHRPWPAYEPVFLHRDFQHYNVLWLRGRPSAVVDWMNICMGPVEMDLQQFRRNLLWEFGNEVAQRYLRIYREVTGIDPDPFWEALNFGDAWTEVPPHMVDDYDAYVASLLSRL